MSNAFPPRAAPLAAAETQRGRAPALGFLLLAAALVYLTTIHHGIAPGRSPQIHWWEPTSFLFEYDLIVELAIRPALGIAVFTAPAALLALGVVLTTRSSWARGLALAAVASTALFAFYAFVGRGVWQFFSWRGTLVLLAIGAAVGFAVAAPWLTESWLRQRAWMKAVLYLPILVGLIAVMRHITGTDETMPFNLSPWPAFSVLGLDLAAYSIAGIQLGLASGLAAAALVARSRRAAWLLAIAAPCLPVLWFLLRHSHPGTPFLLALAAATALLALASARRSLRRGGEEPLRRAFLLSAGAALVVLPVIAGQSLATGDYSVSRFVRAQQLIDALADYYQREYTYPDALEELVELGAIDGLSHPRIGFDTPYELGWLDPARFSYQNLGSSYVLEFEATEWVQCAYNPPWSDEQENYEEDEEVLEVEEAWSCPDSRPDLW